jgi:hypothetical protein
MEYALVDLRTMHPNLGWQLSIEALVAVCDQRGFERPYRWRMKFDNVPGFRTNEAELLINPANIAATDVARAQKTYAPDRLVEYAAIAVAGIAIYHAGRHEIWEVAVRGTGADYLVDQGNCLLEVAGRSRRSDVPSARRERLSRLASHARQGFYLFVAEFETPVGNLEYVSSPESSQ